MNFDCPICAGSGYIPHYPSGGHKCRACDRTGKVEKGFTWYETTSTGTKERIIGENY